MPCAREIKEVVASIPRLNNPLARARIDYFLRLEKMRRMTMAEAWIAKMNLQQESKPDPKTYCFKSPIPDSSLRFD